MLIETGVMGCVWLLLSLSEHVSIKNKGDLECSSSSASPL